LNAYIDLKNIVMNTPEVKEFNCEKSALFWYIPENEIKEFLIDRAIDIL